MSPRKNVTKAHTDDSPYDDIVVALVQAALEAGADCLQTEYESGYEMVYARMGSMGVGIARIESTGPDGLEVIKRFSAMKRKKEYVTIQGVTYGLKATSFENFGEEAFQVTIKVEKGKPQDKKPQGKKPQGKKPQGKKPQGKKPEGKKPQGKK